MENREITIICLGDSLTAGSPGFSGYGTWSGNRKSQYEYWLEKRIEKTFPNQDIEVLNFGVGGDRLWQMLYRYKYDVLRLVPNPDFVLLMGGINDILNVGSHPIGIKKDWAEIADVIEESGAKLIPIEIAPCTVTHRFIERIKESNKGIHEIAKLIESPVVPLYNALADSSGDFMDRKYDIGDGVHFNVEGYKKIGNVIFESVMNSEIEKLLKKTKKD